MLKVIENNRFAEEATVRAHRLREAIALHDIEGNPLTADEVAMFEMFEREGWSPEQRRAYILRLPD